jgi:exodeoxyribonuclease VII large subunit
MVADVRAPTPSAAAEIAIAEKANLLKFLSSVEAAAQQRIVQQITAARQKLSSLQKHPLFSSPYATLAPYIQQIDSYQNDIQASLQLKIEQKNKHSNPFPYSSRSSNLRKKSVSGKHS